jgi:PAS domain S-box-containing protein
MDKLDLDSYTFKSLRQVCDISYSRGFSSVPGNAAVVIANAASKDVQAQVGKLLHNEFSLSALLDPAWAIRPVDSILVAGQPTLLYDDYQAEPLNRRFKSGLPLEHFFPLAIQITTLLKAMHGVGLVHKDIKPATLLIDQEGIVRLSGFGFAEKLEHQGVALNQPFSGCSLAYISPEHTGLSSDLIDSRSDLYSVGVVLYELLTGRLPFELGEAAEPQDWMHCHLVCDVKAPHILTLGIPAWLSGLVLKLLEKDPAQRYQSAAALEADLAYCQKVWRESGDVSPFPLGQFHVPTSLQIPDSVYLRQQEIEKLHSALQHCRVNKHKTLVVLTAAAGMGKSSLIQAFVSDLTTNGFCVAAGKSEQYRNDIPYTTLISAFRFCLKEMMKQPPGELLFWHQRLEQNLSSCKEWAVSLFPELTSVFSDDRVHSIPAGRYDIAKLVLQKMIQALATSDRPFIIALDDIQWLDKASQNFVSQLMSAHSASPLMVLIGARGQSETEVFRNAVTDPEIAHVVDLQLEALDSSQITKIIARTFQTSHPTVLDLAPLVLAKTLGNPFFVSQFLKTIVQKGLLSREPQSSNWLCDSKAIEAIAYTDNVAQDILQRYQLLPAETQKLLVGIACIGRQAELGFLVDLFGLGQGEIQRRVMPALQSDVLYKTDTGYAFYHDLVHSATKALISSEEIQKLDLMIGRRLLSDAILSNRDDELFSAIEHLSKAANLLTEKEERQHILCCALDAAQKAKRANSCQSALYFIDFAGTLLNESSLDHKQTLASLRLELAECEMLTGRLETASDILTEVLQLNSGAVPSARAYRLLTELCLRRSAYQEAVDVALKGLQLFDIVISASPTNDDCLHAYNQLQKRMEEDFRQSFLQLPMMDDPQVEAISDLLASLSVPASFTNENLHFIQLCYALELALDYGVNGATTAALGWIGVLIGHRYGEYEKGMAYCQLARSLIVNHQFVEYEAKTLLILDQLSVWTQPLSFTMDCASACYSASITYGDLATACFSICHQVVNFFSVGKPLDKVLQETQRGLDFSQKVAFIDMELIFVAQQAFVENLHQGKGNRFSGTNLMNTSELLNEDKLSERMSVLVFWYWLYKGISHYLACEYQDAVTSLTKAGDYYWSAPAHIHLLDYHFFRAMALMAAEKEPNAEVMREVLLHKQKIDNWAELNPVSFADRAAILQAEFWHFSGETFKAITAYEAVITLYKTKDFIQYKALAYERAGRLAAEYKQMVAASAYLQQAIQCYKDWAAFSKVRQLEKFCSHSGVSELIVTAKHQHLSDSVSERYLSNLLKASRAITEQVDYAKLMQVLLTIMVEQASAQRVLLLKPVGDSFIIEARAHTTTSGVMIETLNCEAHWDDLPKSLVNTVTRTQKLIYVKAGQQGAPFELDPYFQRFYDITALCLPLFRQGKLIALFYIELKAKEDQLNEQYLNVLKFLASHAAVSIETSRLYSSIEQVNQQRLQLERTLRVADTSLALGEQISRTGSWRWELNKNTLICSEEFCRIFGLDPQRRTILFADFAACVHPDDRKSVLDKINKSVQMEAAIKVEYRIVRGDGSVLYLTGQGSPVFGSDKLIDYVGTVIDITERRASEDALRAAQEDLARVSRITTVGQLTSSIAHEINQPLMSIVANAGAGLRWLHRTAPDLEQVSASLQSIATEGQRAGQIVQSLRSLTKNTKTVLTVLNIHDVLNHILAIARSEMERRKVSLVLQLDAKLPDIFGDMVQLQQVMLNLVMNAIEAMSEVTDRQRVLTISTFNESYQTIDIRVEDTGHGISEETKLRLFDAFYTTKKDGMGMGLTICQSIIENHGGRLSAEARPEVGAVFSVSLPLVKD